MLLTGVGSGMIRLCIGKPAMMKDVYAIGLTDGGLRPCQTTRPRFDLGKQFLNGPDTLAEVLKPGRGAAHS